MPKFEIGDIVKVIGQNSNLYIITNVMEYAGVIEEYDYEMSLIYPIERNSRFVTYNQEQLILHAKKDDKNNEVIVEYARKDRLRKGILDEPEHLKVIKEHYNGNPQPKTPTDVIRYDLLNTIDDCLKAIYDLGVLYEMFGDEAYLQLKELVGNRIRELM